MKTQKRKCLINVDELKLQSFKFQHYRLHFNEVEAVRVIITQTKTRQERFQNNPQPTALCHPLIISSIKRLNYQQRSGLFWSGWTGVNIQEIWSTCATLCSVQEQTVMDTTGSKMTVLIIIQKFLYYIDCNKQPKSIDSLLQCKQKYLKTRDQKMSRLQTGLCGPHTTNIHHSTWSSTLFTIFFLKNSFLIYNIIWQDNSVY